MLGWSGLETTAVAANGARAVISASRVRCINEPSSRADGVASMSAEVTSYADLRGSRRLWLGPGEVLPLWFGVDVPEGSPAGEYHGEVWLRAQWSNLMPGHGADGLAVADSKIGRVQGKNQTRTAPVGSMRIACNGSGGLCYGSGFWIERIAVRLTVADAVLPAHGDHDLWRLSRLRWLDSRAGEIAEVQGSNVESASHFEGAIPTPNDEQSAAFMWNAQRRTVTASGQRTVRLSRLGLPVSMRVGGVEMLAAASELKVTLADGGGLERRQSIIEKSGDTELSLHATKAISVVRSGSSIAFDADAIATEMRASGARAKSRVADQRCPGLGVHLSGEMSSDGLLQMSATITHAASGASTDATYIASQPMGEAAGVCELRDVSLVIPLRSTAVPLINGFGYKGAKRPPPVSWRWDEPVAFGQRGLNCRVWLGSAQAGIQVRASRRRPHRTHPCAEH